MIRFLDDPRITNRSSHIVNCSLKIFKLFFFRFFIGGFLDSSIEKLLFACLSPESQGLIKF